MSYTAPVKDMLFAIEHLANIEQIAQIPGFEDAGLDTAAAVRAQTAEVEARPGISTTSGPWPFVSTRMRDDWNGAAAGAAAGLAACTGAAPTETLIRAPAATAGTRAKRSEWRITSACPAITAKPRPGRAHGWAIVFFLQQE